MNLNNIILRNSPASFSLQKLLIKNNTTTLAGFHHSIRKPCLALVIYKTIKEEFSVQINNNPHLNPNFVTGFTDGEGNFRIEVSKNNERKTG